VEAFRTILRAMYPGRPALADEIQSYGWDHFGGVQWWFGTHLTSDEVIAVNKAFEVLDQGKIRLRGVLGPSRPEEDIDPVDASAGKLHVFDGKLYFLENKVKKTYHRVRCYEIDVRRCVTELRSETKRNRILVAKPTSDVDLHNFTTNYSGRRTLAAFTAAAESEGINATRERLNAALDTLGPRRRGAPTGPRRRGATIARKIIRRN
jgi:hypothetical protein